MRDVLGEIERWQSAGEKVALATVVSVHGSAPRQVGATLAVSAGGEIAGSVSGGCVEPAVIEESLRAIRTGQPKLLEFGITEEQNVEQIGLSCGGEIRVYVERLGDVTRIARALTARQPVARATVIAGEELLGASLVAPETDDAVGTLGDAALDVAAIARARQRLERGESGTEPLDVATGRQSEVFYAVWPAPPSLIVVGAGHISIPLTRIARTLGYHVTIVDPREAFATHERFPEADELLVTWPDEALGQLPLGSSTAVAVLTHDDKFDVPALVAALNAPVGYVGAIGSRGTREARNARLREQGITEEQLARIHGPIGLDIGASTPEEIALAIMAQIVATRHGRRDHMLTRA
jgi:xanthine dehydrogenase accessory factor